MRMKCQNNTFRSVIYNFCYAIACRVVAVRHCIGRIFLVRNHTLNRQSLLEQTKSLIMVKSTRLLKTRQYVTLVRVQNCRISASH
ncbi:hypothetical protein BGX38DRAFT_1152766 [Terfezia claveryi]|nr:hypothetical protein BGX38DRAFT_1152766 [Terfezia claveryi]